MSVEVIVRETNRLLRWVGGAVVFTGACALLSWLTLVQWRNVKGYELDHLEARVEALERAREHAGERARPRLTPESTK